MNRIRCLFALVSVLSWSTGCNKAQSFTAEEMQAARHAMPISEVSLMVRSHYDQTKIIGEIQRRHVPLIIDAQTEESLVRFGAKPALIAALKNEANALTKGQKQAFDALIAQHDSRLTSERTVAAARSNDLSEEQPHATTVVNVAKTETPEERYWKAEAAYRAKKSDLEARVFAEQGRINRLRSSGAHESDLSSAETRLHRYEDELKNLQVPIR
jgi:hypothetical protein